MAAAGTSTGAGWPSPPPSPIAQLWLWTRIGMQSFGGGQATQLLVYDAFVSRRRWMTAAEYTETWALCQIPPGINLLALATIIGWRQDRYVGVVAALVGLLVPSSVLTVVLTAAYGAVSGLPITAHALHGVVSGVAGLGIVMAVRIALPPLRQSALGGRVTLAVSLLLIAAAAIAYLLLNPPVVLVFVGAGVVLTVARMVQRTALRSP